MGGAGLCLLALIASAPCKVVEGEGKGGERKFGEVAARGFIWPSAARARGRGQARARAARRKRKCEGVRELKTGGPICKGTVVVIFAGSGLEASAVVDAK